jgi:hypothetical protein
MGMWRAFWLISLVLAVHGQSETAQLDGLIVEKLSREVF